ncbi:DUF6491 family protein [Novosphingobium olei]|uniref:DUF6491 family protein n=1 Tax=Novosphingobium olei TaxID=2728851 RepID=UPI0030938473|nr:DUF6491 family protein [Novosphingobium olei]
MKAGPIAALIVFGLAACAPMGQGAGTAQRKDVPVARSAGPAQSCIAIAQISESRVRDDRTIDFRTSGNRWYRNTLPYPCSGLGFERAFSYETSLSQLCSTDIIRVIQTNPPMTRGACGLGEFQPVELVK